MMFLITIKVPRKMIYYILLLQFLIIFFIVFFFLFRINNAVSKHYIYCPWKLNMFP